MSAHHRRPPSLALRILNVPSRENTPVPANPAAGADTGVLAGHPTPLLAASFGRTTPLADKEAAR